MADPENSEVASAALHLKKGNVKEGLRCTSWRLLMLWVATNEEEGDTILEGEN